MGGLADKLRQHPEAMRRPPQWKRKPEVLLCSNSVKPLHRVVPRTILGKAWWDQTREKAYASTDYHCVACGVAKASARYHRWLEGHEVYRINYRRGTMTYVETVPLCHCCHCFVHDGRLKALTDKGEVTKEKYDEVMEHGKRVLADAGLVKPSPYIGRMAPWSEWRLILFGKEYPPIFKDYNAWLVGHGYIEED